METSGGGGRSSGSSIHNKDTSAPAPTTSAASKPRGKKRQRGGEQAKSASSKQQQQQEDNEQDDEELEPQDGGGAKSGAAQGQPTLAFIPRRDSTIASFTEGFWKHQFHIAETVQEDFKDPELPLARVKRVMKTDPDVAMIASEVPVILEKACQIFISDLTARAYIESSKRRTLTKTDVVNATKKSDLFDFLIDIVQKIEEPSNGADTPSTSGGTSGQAPPEQQPQQQQQQHTLPEQNHFQSHHAFPPSGYDGGDFDNIFGDDQDHLR